MTCWADFAWSQYAAVSGAWGLITACKLLAERFRMQLCLLDGVCMTEGSICSCRACWRHALCACAKRLFWCTHRRCRALVLDSSYRPIDVVNWQRAICLDLFDKARLLLQHHRFRQRSSAQTWDTALLQYPGMLSLAWCIHAGSQLAVEW